MLIIRWGLSIFSNGIKISLLGGTLISIRQLQGAHPSLRNSEPSSSQNASYSTPSTSISIPPPQSLEFISLNAKVHALTKRLNKVLEDLMKSVRNTDSTDKC
ncbi:hypothetical protein ACMBCN_02980, partial [Candidatus Liberibacter asiaticus]|nr:hypothetical protein [Candidatus Liberibacter asiaticus]